MDGIIEFIVNISDILFILLLVYILCSSFGIYIRIILITPKNMKKWAGIYLDEIYKNPNFPEKADKIRYAINRIYNFLPITAKTFMPRHKIEKIVNDIYKKKYE